MREAFARLASASSGSKQLQLNNIIVIKKWKFHLISNNIACNTDTLKIASVSIVTPNKKTEKNDKSN